MEYHRRRFMALRSLFLASMLVAILILSGFVMWYASPKQPVLMLGTLTDFPSSGGGAVPYYVTTDDYRVFVVNTGDEFIVLDAHATTQRVTRGVRYVVKWVPVNQRYEDPLTASKYTVTGEWLEGPADRDMDRFGYEIVDGVIYAYPWQVIKGAASAWPPHHRRPGLYSYSFCADRGFTRECTFP
jgi:hypothetical protein